MSVVIYTPIYGKIKLNDISKELLSTYELRRIDRISIGAPFFSYPFKAGYSRLEHSIGVAYLAQRLCEQLDIEAADLAVTAGLLHDVGLSPFSHTTEDYMVKFYGKNHKAMGGAIIKGEITISPNIENTIPEILEKHGYDLKEVAAIAVGDSNRSPLYLRDMFNQPLDLDVLDSITHYSDCGFVNIKVHPVKMLKMYTIYEDRLIFDGKYINDIWRITRVRRCFYFDFTIKEKAQMDSMESMLQKAIERALDKDFLDENFVFMDDCELLYTLKQFSYCKDIVQNFIDGKMLPTILMKRITKKQLKEINENKNAIESEIAEKLELKEKYIIVSTQMHGLSNIKYPVLTKEGLKPLYKLLDVASAKMPKYYLFVHCKRQNNASKEIIQRILEKYT